MAKGLEEEACSHESLRCAALHTHYDTPLYSPRVTPPITARGIMTTDVNQSRCETCGTTSSAPRPDKCPLSHPAIYAARHLLRERQLCAPTTGASQIESRSAEGSRRLPLPRSLPLSSTDEMSHRSCETVVHCVDV